MQKIMQDSDPPLFSKTLGLAVEKQNFSTFSTAFSTGVVHTRFPPNYALPVNINNFICLYKDIIFPIILHFYHRPLFPCEISP